MKSPVLLLLLIAASATLASSQKVLNEKTVRTPACGDPNDVVSKIALPKEGKVQNFSLDSVTKTKAGFVMKVNWGASLTHYEVHFNFRCRRSRFYLYRVKKISLLTTHPERGYWDTTKVKVIRIRNLPIEKFVMTRYL